MTISSIAFRGARAAALVAGVILLGGFTFRDGGPTELHYKEYNAQPPRGNTVTVCHAHGCQQQVSFTFTSADILDLSALMDTVRRSDTPAEERRAIAYAIAWMEKRVGPSTGTSNDRAGLGFMNSPGQLDCVDETTNATSYMLVLQSNGLLRHHVVIRPYSKFTLFKWPHFAAMIKERLGGSVYAVDSGVGPNGSNPAINLASQWDIDEIGPAPARAPVWMVNAAPARLTMPERPRDNIGLLVEQILQKNQGRP